MLHLGVEPVVGVVGTRARLLLVALLGGVAGQGVHDRDAVVLEAADGVLAVLREGAAFLVLARTRGVDQLGQD